MTGNHSNGLNERLRILRHDITGARTAAQREILLRLLQVLERKRSDNPKPSDAAQK
jgi:hypothetical protein